VGVGGSVEIVERVDLMIVDSVVGGSPLLFS
jgi:hypothetical protein